MAEEEQTLAVLPEGVMLNFLLRRVNPTPYTNFMPIEVNLFGEQKMLEAFRSHPRDWIMLAHKHTSEQGFRFFGQDYGQKLFGWIRENYNPVGVVGPVPLQSHQPGIMLLARRGLLKP